jgi:hypothetical protein
MTPQDFHAFTQSIFINPSLNVGETISDKADRLGLLRAQIATLTDQADKLRAELEAAGLPRIEGKLYSVSFAQCSGRAVIDWAGIAQRFNPSRQLIQAHTTTSKETTRMTVAARTVNH